MLTICFRAGKRVEIWKFTLMSLPMQMIQMSVQPKFPMGAPVRYGAAAGNSGFSAYANTIAAESNSYADMDIKDIQTKKVKVKTVDEHGNIKEEIKEMAVCPECGETNCPCIARVTVQSRLDEENAKGVRNAEKPNPMSVIPQSFAQLSMNLDQKTSSSPYFRSTT